MSALDRYDEWAESLDEVLDPASSPPDLRDVYDDATLRAIDGGLGEPASTPRPVGGWRGGATAGAMVVGLVQGVQTALDDDLEPVEEIDEEARRAGREPVTVYLVPGDPAASVAIVRRWLLGETWADSQA